MGIARLLAGARGSYHRDNSWRRWDEEPLMFK